MRVRVVRARLRAIGIAVGVVASALMVPSGAVAAEVPGTPAADVLIGTPDADTLRGKGGDDELWGREAADTLYGGPDDDRLFGEDGDDLLLGGRGTDHLDGGPGADTLRAGRGNDVIESYGDGSVDDVTCGAGGADRVLADPTDLVSADCEQVSTDPTQDLPSEAARIAGIAKSKLGAPWVFGTEGPDRFDCSGYVYWVFKQAGLVARIGGSRRTVRGYWGWFAERGRASTTNGRRGDLVVWGGGQHVGIYLGRGKAISSLTNGVQLHRLHNLTAPFTTFLHVRLERDV